MKDIDVDKITVASIEHFDQNESDGNAATKYKIEFTGKINCEWLWSALIKALEESQRQPIMKPRSCLSCENHGFRCCVECIQFSHYIEKRTRSR